MRTRILARYMTMFGIGWGARSVRVRVLVDRFGWRRCSASGRPVALAAFLLGWTLPRLTALAARAVRRGGRRALALALSCLLLALNRLRPPGPDTADLRSPPPRLPLFYRRERRFSRRSSIRYFRTPVSRPST